MKITVAGVGYVGLSLAVLLAQNHEVTAITTTDAKADKLNQFISPIQDDEIERFFAEAREGKRTLSLHTTTDKAEMKKIIIHERRMELAFEGHRWFDMIRIDGGQYAVNFLHSIGKKNASIGRLLYPVPQVERDANPLFTQNEAYK